MAGHGIGRKSPGKGAGDVGMEGCGGREEIAVKKGEGCGGIRKRQGVGEGEKPWRKEKGKGAGG